MAKLPKFEISIVGNDVVLIIYSSTDNSIIVDAIYFYH